MMKRGVWHQFGDRSQKLALEQLNSGIGVGVVISPRDLGRAKAVEYAAKYREWGASVIIDQQFYLPNSGVGKLEDYPISKFRDSVSQLRDISNSDLSSLQAELERDHRALHCDAVVAPAVVFDSTRQEVLDLNFKLFNAAKKVGDNLGVPTYATVVIGLGAASSEQGVNEVLDAVTGLTADGWYYSYEFAELRIPRSLPNVLQWCKAGLTLAATRKPLLCAFAGPMSLLAPAFAATGVGVGHSQNLWQFDRARWQPSQGGGGGGAAPPRFFSTELWGTLVYPDEMAQIGASLVQRILTRSPFMTQVSQKPPFLPWDRWTANKHLVYVICQEVNRILSIQNPRSAAKAIVDRLSQALKLHAEIAELGVELKDETDSYQGPWKKAVEELLAKSGDEYDYLELLDF